MITNVAVIDSVTNIVTNIIVADPDSDPAETGTYWYPDAPGDCMGMKYDSTAKTFSKYVPDDQLDML